MTAVAPTIALRDYQRAAVAAIHEAEARGVRRQLLVLPTGTGKTLCFAELIAERGGRALVLVHRDELARQAVEKIGLVIPGEAVGVVKAERDEHTSKIVVASVQTLARSARLERITADFRTVIIDEGHHLTADSYGRILDHLHVADPEGPLGVGVTATPERGDGEPLAGWSVVFRRELLEMIRAGYLADLRALQVRIEADFSSLHVRAGDFIEREAERMLLEANAPEHAARAYCEHAAGRQALLFTPTMRAAHAMSKALETAGVRAEALDGETPIEIRREILGRFHRGETQVIANCSVLTEGFDEPGIGCIIVARPTRSKLLYQQMLGRGTRLHPGKADCLVIDLVGATDRHDLMTAATLFRLPAREIAERGVAEASALAEHAEQERVHQGELVAHTIDLFRRRPLHWIPAGPGRFILALGDEGTLALAQHGERWSVLVKRRDGSDEVLAAELPLDYAQGTGEDFARSVGARAFIDPKAAWRTAEVTDRQLAALRRCRIRPRAGLTRGEASDLLSAVVAGATVTR